MYAYPPLAFAPHTARAVSWSADGRLCLQTGHNVERELLCVLNPTFPISEDHFSLQKLGDGFIFPTYKPPDNSSEESEVDSDDIENGISNLTARQAGIYSTGAVWSPPGIGTERNCALAWMAATGYAGIWEVTKEGWRERWNVQRMMEGHEYGDYNTRRMFKLRRRVALLEWAKPLVEEGGRWPICFLSAGNDSGELVIFRVSQKAAELVAVTRFGIHLDEGIPAAEGTEAEASSAANSTEPKAGTQRRVDDEDLINAMDPEWRESLKDTSIPRPRPPRPICQPIGSISWGPWIKEGDYHKAFILASYRHEAIIKTARLQKDGTLEVLEDAAVVGEAWSPQHHVSQVAFYDKVYNGHIVFAYSIQAQVRVVHAKVDVKEFIISETFFTQTFENGYIDPVSALVFIDTPDGLELHLGTMGGGSQIVRPNLPREEVPDNRTPRSKRRWNEVLAYAREDFKVSNDIPYSLARVWGLGRSPLGYSIAAAYTTDADWSLVYRMTAHQNTYIAFGEEVSPAAAIKNNLQGTIPSVFELPSEGFLSDAAQWGEEGYEVLKEAFGKRGFGKDLDLANVQISEEGGSIINSLSRNIYHNRPLKITRFQTLIRFLPQYLQTFGKTHAEIVQALQYEPAVVAHLVANILSVPEEYAVSPLDISCLYSAMAIALTAFHQLAPIRNLVENSLKHLQTKTKLPLENENALLQARKAGEAPPGAQLEHPFEKCKSCDEPLLTTDLAVAECKNGHRVLRCSLTFLPISGSYKRCRLCERPVMLLEEKHELEVQDSDRLVSALLNAWDVCAYCGGTYSA